MTVPLHQAFRLHESGRLHEAAEFYQQILRESPKHADALNLMGQCCFHLGAHDDALKYLKRCLKVKPAHALAHRNLGDVLHQLGDFPGALEALKRSAALDPTQDDIHISIGTLLYKQGKHQEALPHCEKAIAAAPGSAAAHNLLGATLHRLGRNSEAEPALRRALAFDPMFAEAHNNLGLLLNSFDRGAEAAASFRSAITHDPRHVAAYANLAITDGANISLHDAEQLCRQALDIDPSFRAAYINLGGILQQQGRCEEAENCFEQVIENDAQDLHARSNWLFIQHLIAGRSAEVALEHARLYGKSASASVGKRYRSWLAARSPQKLRIGFVSGDLRNHPVGRFLEGTLSQMSTERLELFAYPTTRVSDDLTDRVRRHFASWKPISGLSDKEAAETVRADGVHILIDLSGHTEGNRLTIFAWKPAPVQVTWLGYFATTGVAEIDYLIADETGVPVNEAKHFSERVFYLPETRLCYTPPAFDIAVSELPALGNGFITFGNFQNRAKIGDCVLRAWAKVLSAVPQARLKLQSKQYDDPAIADELASRFEQFGGDRSRLLLKGVTPFKEYLAAHQHIDVILDTFPYPGGTTTCEALWSGVPTITLAGNTLLARQGASLLKAVGLSEWIASTESAYVDLAIAFANDLPALATLRSSLRTRALASPLFDARRFAEKLEDALWSMWYQREERPAAR